jgi:hypothetical protein
MEAAHAELGKGCPKSDPAGMNFSVDETDDAHVARGPGLIGCGE